MVQVPEKTEVSVADNVVRVKGPHGELSRVLPAGIAMLIADKKIAFKPEREDMAALWGTSAAHVANMIEGVNKPFQKKLVIEGIGYRAEISGSTLSLQLGFSHPVKMAIPKNLTVSVAKNVISIEGVDKEAVGQFAATIRAKKKPEPYKGKGIRYDTEVVKRKQGKRSTA